MSLSNNSTLPQSVEIVDPEGSCKKDNSEPINQVSEFEFYYNRYYQFYKNKPKAELIDLIAYGEALKAVRGGSQ